MTITTTDGHTQELLLSDVADITFEEESLPVEADQNADQIIIKEVYCGGCPTDDGTGFFQMDKCIILYNNCPQEAVVNNLCIGMGSPSNAHANNYNYGDDGKLTYESENFIPVWNGV
jgi:hypothetical protein